MQARYGTVLLCYCTVLQYRTTVLRTTLTSFAVTTPVYHNMLNNFYFSGPPGGRMYFAPMVRAYPNMHITRIHVLYCAVLGEVECAEG